MFVLLFGVLFSGSGNSKITVGWVDQDGSPASAGLRSRLSRNVPLLNLQNGTLEAEKAADAARRRLGDHRDPEGLQDAAARPRPAEDIGRRSSSTRTRPRPRPRRSCRAPSRQIANGFNLALAGGSEVADRHRS